MDNIILIKQPITKDKLKPIAKKLFGDFIKAVVDIEKKIIAAGGSMHADEESFLLEHGSKQKNLWGINLYPNLEMPDMIEFDSMINIRPRQNNRSRSVEDETIRGQIKSVVAELIQ